MNQRKPNRRAWYSLMLPALLCVGILVLATGATFARYRAERDQEIGFNIQVPDQIHLGTVKSVLQETDSGEEAVMADAFTPSSQLTWETEDGVTKLVFAVANGISKEEYSKRDQVARVRMIGTLGIWDGVQTPTLSLTIPAEAGNGEELVIEATAVPLEEGTTLQHAYGDGWQYAFLDENGEELLLELPGGELSIVKLVITIEDEVPETLNLLQPLVMAEALQERSLH